MSAWYDVPYVVRNPAAAVRSTPAGMRYAFAASTTTFSAKPPVPVPAATRSPTAQSVTSDPTRRHGARDLATGRERQRRLELVEVLHHQDVGEVDAAGVHVDEELVRLRRRVRRPPRRRGSPADRRCAGCAARIVAVNRLGPARGELGPRAVERLGHRPAPALEALLDPLDERLEHGDPGVALLLAGHEVPRREVVVGALEHLLGGDGVLVGLLAVAPVLVGDLPPPQRVVLAVLEPAQLLVGADLQPELDEDHALRGESSARTRRSPRTPAATRRSWRSPRCARRARARTSCGRRRTCRRGPARTGRSATGSCGASRRTSAWRTT